MLFIDINAGIKISEQTMIGIPATKYKTNKSSGPNTSSSLPP